MILEYSEDREVLKHNDSSDSLVDAVAATGEKSHDRFCNTMLIFVFVYMVLSQKHCVLVTMILANHDMDCLIMNIQQSLKTLQKQLPLMMSDLNVRMCTPTL